MIYAVLFTGSKGTAPRIAWLLRAELPSRGFVRAQWRSRRRRRRRSRRRRRRRSRSRRRSRTKKPESSIKPTKTPHSPTYRKQRTAHCEWRRLARARTDKHPPIPQRQHHPATPSSENRQTPGGGIEPPRRQAAPGTLNPPTPPQTDRETRRRDETPKSPVRDSTTPGGGIEPPRRQSAPGISNSNLRPDRTDRPTDRLTDPPRANLPRRLAPQRPVRAGRRIPIRALRRLRRRPRRQPAVSAAARACRLLRRRPKPSPGAWEGSSASTKDRRKSWPPVVHENLVVPHRQMTVFTVVFGGNRRIPSASFFKRRNLTCQAFQGV